MTTSVTLWVYQDFSFSRHVQPHGVLLPTAPLTVQLHGHDVHIISSILLDRYWGYGVDKSNCNHLSTTYPFLSPRIRTARTSNSTINFVPPP